ncbi:MAG: hypothetical protein H6R18_1021 [Proteobacteria bacterium]|nr:hypothetical protein [Pseudomonadota bacterium]
MKKMLLVLCLGLLSHCAFAQQVQRIDLNFGFYRVDIEVVADQASRMQGLMNRRIMAPQQGMLFVFPEVARHCMWMRNTFIPLSVAFLDTEGRIINIEDMQPHTENSHCSARPARFALEMNLGWFASKGIKPGARPTGLEKVPEPR